MAEAVRSRFPRLAAALGDEPFELMLAQYLEREPAARTSVRESGARLAGFLAANAYPIWYAELAALDRAHVEVITAPSMATMMRRDLTCERPLVLVPAHALVEVTTASDELWATLERMPIAGSGSWNRSVRTLEWARCVIVWRDREGAVRDRTVSPDEGCALEAAQRGTTLGELAALFGGANPHASALDAVVAWIDGGLLVR